MGQVEYLHLKISGGWCGSHRKSRYRDLHRGGGGEWESGVTASTVWDDSRLLGFQYHLFFEKYISTTFFGSSFLFGPFCTFRPLLFFFLNFFF